MDGEPPPSRVVGVFAHPDDEVFCAGGTFALWARGGADIVVLCATRGDAGQIRDAAVATRRTLGAVREAELRVACAELGVRDVRLLDHGDGTLAVVDRDELFAAVRALIDECDPDVVVTFGEDGAYGHPDHVTIGEVTADVVRDVRRRRGDRGPRLMRSHFARNDLSLAERLAAWLLSMEDRFGGAADYGRALSLFAQESTTMRFASDDVRVVWFPPGSLIIEQGEPATSLYLVLSGTVEVVQETEGDEVTPLRTLGEGQFFGELGVARSSRRSATVVAVGNVTCLALSRHAPTHHDGRGDSAADASIDVTQPERIADQAGIVSIDVTATLEEKMRALVAHRSQYPIDLALFPRSMLEDMYGVERFVDVRDG